MFLNNLNERGVVLGFSGGVDSSLSACLLRERGYEVHCVYLETGSGEAENARSAAEKLKLPFEIIDARELLEEKVCRPFTEAYLRGETPNPCVLCNPSVKLKTLCERADALGCAHIATGHYARVENGALYAGRLPNDQSYMLCRILPEQLSRMILPLGEYEKTRVRALARERGLFSAEKPDSMEICFLRGGDYADWIERRTELPAEGDIIYHGRAVARHRGIWRYTLGQRRGLGFAAGERVYVSEIRPETNEVVLSDGDGLFKEVFFARDMRWLSPGREGEFPCRVRVRHSRTMAEALALPRDGGVEIRLESPIRAPTPGQAAALYDGERVIGGAVIE